MLPKELIVRIITLVWEATDNDEPVDEVIAKLETLILSYGLVVPDKAEDTHKYPDAEGELNP